MERGAQAGPSAHPDPSLLSPVFTSLISPHSGCCLQTAVHLPKQGVGETAQRVALTTLLPNSISLQILESTQAP